jgi:hypothetical protein
MVLLRDDYQMGGGLLLFHSFRSCFVVLFASMY